MPSADPRGAARGRALSAVPDFRCSLASEERAGRPRRHRHAPARLPARRAPRAVGHQRPGRQPTARRGQGAPARAPRHQGADGPPAPQGAPRGDVPGDALLPGPPPAAAHDLRGPGRSCWTSTSTPSVAGSRRSMTRGGRSCRGRCTASARTAGTTPAAPSGAGRSARPSPPSGPRRPGRSRTSGVTGSPPTWSCCRTASTTGASTRTSVLDVTALHEAGRLDLDRLRGRSTLPMPAQYAEIALRRHLGEDGLDAVRLTGRDGEACEFQHDEARWRVTVHPHAHRAGPAHLLRGQRQLATGLRGRRHRACMSTTRDHSRATDYLAAVTRILQQARLADPTGGLWEAADLHWCVARGPARGPRRAAGVVRRRRARRGRGVHPVERDLGRRRARAARSSRPARRTRPGVPGCAPPRRAGRDAARRGRRGRSARPGPAGFGAQETPLRTAWLDAAGRPPVRRAARGLHADLVRRRAALARLSQRRRGG